MILWYNGRQYKRKCGELMKLSTRGRYALRVMVNLAQYPPKEFVPLKDIAEKQGLALKYLEQVVAPLSREGHLLSSRGVGGGYCLARKPEEYTVGEILRLTEGVLSFVSCLREGSKPCPRAADCETLPLWKGVQKVMDNYLDSVTLADMVSGRIPGLEEEEA